MDSSPSLFSSMFAARKNPETQFDAHELTTAKSKSSINIDYIPKTKQAIHF